MDLPGFTIILFSEKQLIVLLLSDARILVNFTKVFVNDDDVPFSAKFCNEASFIQNKESLKIGLNRIRPTIVPWGTQEIIFFKSL